MSAGDVFEVHSLDDAFELLRLEGVAPSPLEVVGIIPLFRSVIVIALDLDDVPGLSSTDVLDMVADDLRPHLPVGVGKWFAVTATSAGDLVGIERTGGGAFD